MGIRIVPLLVVISSGVFGQKTECNHFTDGRFKIIDPVIGNTVIQRKRSTQIEYAEKNGLKVKFKVKWLNDCMYTLELKRVIKNPDCLSLPEGVIFNVEIIETREKSYIQRTSCDLYGLTLESELVRIE